MNRWQLKASLDWKVGRIKCLLTGHGHEVTQYWLPGKPWYCEDCLQEYPDYHQTLPGKLSRAYKWTVDQNWKWFERLDRWLLENHRHKLPKWWEY